jgi:hypothetical protein
VRYGIALDFTSLVIPVATMEDATKSPFSAKQNHLTGAREAVGANSFGRIICINELEFPRA